MKNFKFPFLLYILLLAACSAGVQSQRMWSDLKKTQILPESILDSIAGIKEWNPSNRNLLFKTFKKSTFRILSEQEKKIITENDTTIYWTSPIPDSENDDWNKAYYHTLDILVEHNFLSNIERDKLRKKIKSKVLYPSPYYFFEDILNETDKNQVNDFDDV
ncbi:MAG: hypothetical protein ACK40G_05350 [Cytophagaceae bacterium]